MSFKIEKLDGRHKGSSYFSHRVLVQGLKLERLKEFQTVREWCWATWGPSCEREIYLSFAFNKIENRPLHWAWHYEVQFDECYIYITGPKELELFTLKWL